MRSKAKRRNGIAGIAWAALIATHSIVDAWAWPPTYGSEFNFSNPKLDQHFRNRIKLKPGDAGQVPDEVEQHAARELADEIERQCKPDCRKIVHAGKFGNDEYRFEFKEGFWFNVGVDPGVVEIQTQPGTLDEVRRQAPFLDRWLFRIAQRKGLVAKGNIAHFNVGALAAFAGKPKEFMAFIVDFANHPELSSGIFGVDYANAPPVSHLRPRQKAALQEIQSEVDRGLLLTVEDIAEQIESRVYTWTPYLDQPIAYQAMSFKALVRWALEAGNDRPIELRAVRQPKDAAEWALFTEMMEERIKYLRNRPEAPVLAIPDKTVYSPETLKSRFYAWLEETGLEWNRFQSLLPPEIRRAPFDAFVAGTLNLARPDHLQLVDDYAKTMEASPWVRKKLLSALDRPQARSSERIAEILKDLTERAKRSPRHAEVIGAFLHSLASKDSWKGAQWLAELRQAVATANAAKGPCLAPAGASLRKHL